MQRGPQAGVRIAFVVLGVVCFREIDGRQCTAPERLDRSQRITLLRLLNLAAGTDPYGSVTLDRWQKRGGEASHHRFAGRDTSNAVGYYNDRHDGSATGGATT